MRGVGLGSSSSRLEMSLIGGRSRLDGTLRLASCELGSYRCPQRDMTEAILSVVFESKRVLWTWFGAGCCQEDPTMLLVQDAYSMRPMSVRLAAEEEESKAAKSAHAVCGAEWSTRKITPW